MAGNRPPTEHGGGLLSSWATSSPTWSRLRLSWLPRARAAFARPGSAPANKVSWLVLVNPTGVERMIDSLPLAEDGRYLERR